MYGINEERNSDRDRETQRAEESATRRRISSKKRAPLFGLCSRSLLSFGFFSYIVFCTPDSGRENTHIYKYITQIQIRVRIRIWVRVRVEFELALVFESKVLRSVANSWVRKLFIICLFYNAPNWTHKWQLSWLRIRVFIWKLF